MNGINPGAWVVSIKPLPGLSRVLRPLHNHPFLNLPRPARLLWLTLPPNSGIYHSSASEA
jgi:hypothetical protein